VRLPELTPRQNARLRRLILRAMREEGATQATFGSYVGLSQCALSKFLRKENGTHRGVAEGLADHLGVPLSEVLGEDVDLASLPPRGLAAAMARQLKVSEQAIKDILDEPPDPTVDFSANLICNRMVAQHQHLLGLGPPPPPPRPRR
jgi:transcriptional regulator with XRE-family HTH domain